MNPKLMADLVMRCLHMVTMAHVKHLSTRSFARHKALEGLYEAIGDLADGVCESVQGKYGLMVLDGSYAAPKDELQMVLELAQWMETNEPKFTDSWVQNQIQEIEKLLWQTVYRIRYLS